MLLGGDDLFGGIFLHFGMPFRNFFKELFTPLHLHRFRWLFCFFKKKFYIFIAGFYGCGKLIFGETLPYGFSEI